MGRKGLGRGLSTLLAEKDSSFSGPTERVVEEVGAAVEAESPQSIAAGSISPNPFQPRIDFDPTTLDELADSIRKHGLLEPLLVRPHPAREGRFELIAGERRHRAALLAGLQSLPAVIRQTSDPEMLEIAVVENIQREDLNPIEEGRAYKRLIEMGGEDGETMTQEQVAEKVGKSRAFVANTLRLLDLPDYIQGSILTGTTSRGHGKVMVGLEEALLRQCYLLVTQQGASVRALEEFVKRGGRSPSTGKKSRSRKQKITAQEDPHYRDLEEALMERLGTQVRIRKNQDDSGQIEAPFYNSEDLDRLLEALDVEL